MPSPADVKAAATLGVYDSIINEFKTTGAAIIHRPVEIDSVRGAVVAQFLADGWYASDDTNRAEIVVIYPDVAPDLWDVGTWDAVTWKDSSNPGAGK